MPLGVCLRWPVPPVTAPEAREPQPDAPRCPGCGDSRCRYPSLECGGESLPQPDAEVVEVLAEHEYTVGLRVCCACGYWRRPDPTSGESLQDVHRRHVASLLAEREARARREGAADALGDLWERCVKADDALRDLAAKRPTHEGPERLHTKRDGVRLVRSYIEEARRIREGDAGG